MAAPGFNLFDNQQLKNGGQQIPWLTPKSVGGSTPPVVSGIGAAPSDVPSGGSFGNTPGAVAPATGTANPINPHSPYPYDPQEGAGLLGGAIKQGGTGVTTLSTQYPNFTAEFYDWLAQQMGKGATPYNQSAMLPSSGQPTGPGQVNAPLTDTLSMLQNFYKTGSGGPTGAGALQKQSQTGNPTDVGPAWEAMVAAQQNNIQKNYAQLQEQYGKFGTLKGSPYGRAAGEFAQQTALDQNSLLAQMHQQAQESAAGRSSSATSELFQGAGQLGQLLQGLDQQSITNMMTEFIRTRPEYGPVLNQIYGMAGLFPPAFQSGTGAGIGSSLIGAGVSGIAGGAAAAAGGAGVTGTVLAGLAAMCWIAAEVYDEDIVTSPRVNLIRNWLVNHYEKTLVGHFVVGLYRKYGQRVALYAKHHSFAKRMLRKLFDKVLLKAQE